MEMEQYIFDVALSHFPKFGPRSLKQIYDHFDSSKDAYHANELELISSGVHPSVAKQFQYFKQEIDPTELLKKVKRTGLTLLTPASISYPSLLKTIFDPPQLLYVQGTLPAGSQPRIAIVGSRKCSNYGEQVAQDFSKAFAKAGIVVVSGLAYGIDSHAHKGTVAAGGQTIAVLACGHDQITGRARHIAQAILAGGGAIISEFPPGTPAFPYHHPIRNRIISGMCPATLVVEAAIKSGSLITAKAAIDQNREVFAIPGNINAPMSEGTNKLLKDGAHMAITPQDVLEHFAIQPSLFTQEKREQPTLSKNSSQIVQLLSRQPIHIDELTRKTQLEPRIIAQELSLLELDGLTKQIGGMYYILT